LILGDGPGPCAEECVVHLTLVEPVFVIEDQTPLLILGEKIQDPLQRKPQTCTCDPSGARSLLRIFWGCAVALSDNCVTTFFLGVPQEGSEIWSPPPLTEP
jgi:hypothetical protein